LRSAHTIRCLFDPPRRRHVSSPWKGKGAAPAYFVPDAAPQFRLKRCSYVSAVRVGAVGAKRRQPLRRIIVTPAIRIRSTTASDTAPTTVTVRSLPCSRRPRARLCRNFLALIQRPLMNFFLANRLPAGGSIITTANLGGCKVPRTASYLESRSDRSETLRLNARTATIWKIPASMVSLRRRPRH